jgi:hypothetical protein
MRITKTIRLFDSASVECFYSFHLDYLSAEVVKILIVKKQNKLFSAIEKYGNEAMVLF